MKEVSNVFQFHFNCCLKLKETIRPRSVLHLGPEMDPVPPQQFGRNDKAGVTLQPWRIQNMFQCLNNSSESILDLAKTIVYDVYTKLSSYQDIAFQ